MRSRRRRGLILVATHAHAPTPNPAFRSQQLPAVRWALWGLLCISAIYEPLRLALSDWLGQSIGGVGGVGGLTNLWSPAVQSSNGTEWRPVCNTTAGRSLNYCFHAGLLSRSLLSSPLSHVGGDVARGA